jgi:hypothetical protein
MKNLLLYLIMFTTLTMQCQISTESIGLTLVYNSIKKRALQNQIDVDTLTLTKNGFPVEFKDMKLVDSMPGNRDVIGLTRWIPKGDHYHAYIFIHRKLLKDINVLEEVVAHECGHIWGLSHSCTFCGDIMTSLSYRYHYGTSRYYNRFLDKQKTEMKWKKFFNKIKAKENEEYSIKNR